MRPSVATIIAALAYSHGDAGVELASDKNGPMGQPTQGNAVTKTRCVPPKFARIKAGQRAARKKRRR